MALSVGLRLGPYEILDLLGAGGMSEVYRARDTRLDRTVAIKILPEALASDSQFRERFDREARAISHLDHPHICALYDGGQHEGTSSLVMQYLEGETLELSNNVGENRKSFFPGPPVRVALLSGLQVFHSKSQHRSFVAPPE
jgi:serine/threonine protein kinase